jgi:hypothetical protein
MSSRAEEVANAARAVLGERPVYVGEPSALEDATEYVTSITRQLDGIGIHVPKEP